MERYVIVGCPTIVSDNIVRKPGVGCQVPGVGFKLLCFCTFALAYDLSHMKVIHPGI